MDPVRQATAALFERYLEKLSALEVQVLSDVNTSVDSDLEWLCRTALEQIETHPIDKLSRWLGFVQGALTANRLLNVREERDFSRPIFHNAYRATGQDIPPTLEPSK